MIASAAANEAAPRLERAAARLEGQRHRLERRSALFSRVRLGIVLTGALVVGLAASGEQSGLAWYAFGIATAVFAIAARLHEGVALRLRAHRIAIGLRHAELARMDCRWDDIPPPVDVTGAIGLPGDHAFAADLNLFGPRSVHHLFDTALSRDGSRELGRWLLDDALDRAAERQMLVRELQDMPLFRYRLAVAAGLVRINEKHPFDGEVLLGWLGRRKVSRRVRVLLGVLTGLAAMNITLVTTHALGWTPALWLFSFTAYAAVYLLNNRHYEHLFDDAEHLYYQLRHLRPVLSTIERFRFNRRPGLRALCRPLQEGSPPSRELARLARLSAAASTQKSEVLRVVLNVLVPWDLFFSVRLASAGERLYLMLPEWLRAWRTLEAAGSLAAWAWRHPEATFPEFPGDAAHAGEQPAGASPVGGSTASSAVGPGGALLEADALGHPLIPPAERVCNDFSLGGPGHVVLITGSNMSGKSTFLRTVGVNVVLARAGSAVAASRMTLRPCRLFTSINVSDSLGDGMSYFYAEVKRLRALLSALEDASGAPLLFLVDEIFRGTNNRERYAGSKAILEALRAGRGAGLVTTHDLELVHLVGLDNRHFREHIEHGRMAFDYLLHDGPCPTTNALAIMKMEGLPVGGA